MQPVTIKAAGMIRKRNSLLYLLKLQTIPAIESKAITRNAAVL